MKRHPVRLQVLSMIMTAVLASSCGLPPAFVREEPPAWADGARTICIREELSQARWRECGDGGMAVGKLDAGWVHTGGVNVKPIADRTRYTQAASFEDSAAGRIYRFSLQWSETTFLKALAAEGSEPLIVVREKGGDKEAGALRLVDTIPLHLAGRLLDREIDLVELLPAADSSAAIHTHWIYQLRLSDAPLPSAVLHVEQPSAPFLNHYIYRAQDSPVADPLARLTLAVVEAVNDFLAQVEERQSR